MAYVLIRLVKENGICKMIEDYKLELEYNDYIVKRYSNNWKYISRNEILPSKFIEKYHNKIIWKEVFRYLYTRYSDNAKRAVMKNIDIERLKDFVRGYENKYKHLLVDYIKYNDDE